MTACRRAVVARRRRRGRRCARGRLGRAEPARAVRGRRRTGGIGVCHARTERPCRGPRPGDAGRRAGRLRASGRGACAVRQGDDTVPAPPATGAAKPRWPSGLGILLEYEGRTQERRARITRRRCRWRGTLGDRDLECRAINGLGSVDLTEGRMDEALARYERALALARETGDRRMQGSLLGNLGNRAHRGWARGRGRRRHEEALVIARETGHRVLEGNTLCNLGMLFIVLDRLARSRCCIAGRPRGGARAWPRPA